MPDDGLNVFRIGVIVIAVIGMINTLFVIRRSTGDEFTLGRVTMDKDRWTWAVLLFNAVGIPIVAIVLFGFWRS